MVRRGKGVSAQGLGVDIVAVGDVGGVKTRNGEVRFM
jgi:hypothetical protein